MSELPTSYQMHRQPMLCGSHEAETRKYHKYASLRDPARIWLVADQPNAADNIYVGYPFDTKSNGFAGRWLTFPLVDGGVIQLQGPWHSNSEALFKDTGIDVRDKTYTFVVIGKRLEYSERGFMCDTIYDLVHIDEDWTLGTFKRGDEIAERLTNELDCPLYLYMQTSGGSSAMWKFPAGTTWDDWIYDKERGTHTGRKTRDNSNA